MLLVNFEWSQHSTHSVERLDNELKELGRSPLKLLKERSLHAETIVNIQESYLLESRYEHYCAGNKESQRITWQMQPPWWAIGIQVT